MRCHRYAVSMFNANNKRGACFKLYIGGGNVKHLDKEGLPDDVVVVDNMAGLLGGIRLWN